MLHSSRIFTLSSLSLLAACTANTSEDSGSGSDDTADYIFSMKITNGVTDVGIADIEACVEIPVDAEPVCNTSDANGMIESTYSPDDVVEGNAIIGLSGEGYWTTLNLGRVNADVLAAWDESMETGGIIEFEYPIISEVLINAALNDSGITPEAGTGHAATVLFAAEGTSVAGATITVWNEDGSEVNSTAYSDDAGATFDPTLTATTESGAFGSFNLSPGLYSMEITLEGATCGPAIAWEATEAGAIPFIVRADSISVSGVTCTVE